MNITTPAGPSDARGSVAIVLPHLPSICRRSIFNKLPASLPSPRPSFPLNNALPLHLHLRFACVIDLATCFPDCLYSYFDYVNINETIQLTILRVKMIKSLGISNAKFWRLSLNRDLNRNFMQNRKISESDVWIVLTPSSRQTATGHIEGSRSSRVRKVLEENGIRFPRTISSGHIQEGSVVRRRDKGIVYTAISKCDRRKGGTPFAQREARRTRDRKRARVVQCRQPYVPS